MDKICFELDKKDLLSAGREIWKIPYFRSQYNWMIILPIVCALVFIAILFLPVSEKAFDITCNICIFGFVFFVYLDFILYFTTGRAMYKVLKGTDMARTITLQEDGIFSENSTSNGLIKWNGILHVARGKNTIFLFIGKRLTVLIPKRAFNSEDELNEFYNIVNEKVNAVKK